ncbi:PstA family ABC transporter permease [Photobacterium alginatilyticum]|uniref:ABC transporter permease subunit n=1 Tax=Photobacterium alginatilyticum TaxID=1775171 RepID=A0ABW9YDV6_9GAMM|nr:ABC transporter permease subunit [Photobacterium alginatilyticum]NBI51379.1 ABC transporter permease subunit [Photobacterium alginatilyticum]
MKLRLFHLWCLCSTVGLITCLTVLLGFIITRGTTAFDFTLFFGDTDPLKGIFGIEPIWDGIWPACVGTLTVVTFALSLALLPGVATGIWLAISPATRFSRVLAFGIDILAGIPSILMGLFGFTLILFLRNWLLPSANTCLVLSALSLAILIIPYLAVATRTALLALPPSLEHTALSLGMTRWQALRSVLLPQAAKGISGGIMLAAGRAAEDTAVIMLTGVVANAGLPGGIFERYEALPFTIFYYSAQYQSDTELQMAFGAALTLLCLTATIFSVASFLIRTTSRRQ